MNVPSGFRWGGHPPSRGAGRRSFRYLASVAAVCGATCLAWWCRARLSLPDIAVLYTLGITGVAALEGAGPSAVAAGLSVLAYNYFFIPPVFAFGVEDTRHLLTFAMMFGVAVVTSTLISRIRQQDISRARLAEQAKNTALRAQTEEMRSSLLSTVSHDLRTPLAAITAAATTLRDESKNVPAVERADLVDTICEEAERLERLVENLLDMTRLESGGFQVKREWASLDELLTSAAARAESRLHDHRVTLDLPDDLIVLSVDPILLEQVVVNLLDNAIKYAPGTSPIEVTARSVDGSIEIEVMDAGPGLAAGIHERVFEKFYRGAHPGLPGAGLGLSICRGIVAAHGGVITAHDRAGGGAVFRISLPRATNAPPIPRERERDANAERVAL